MAKTISDLNNLNRESEQADKDTQGEMRTNLQLCAGDHFNSNYRGSKFWNRIRDAKQLSPEIRLRLTKNHIGRIAKLYENAIQAHAPGVKVVPKIESEIQSQKAAEQHNAVWQDVKTRHKINKKIRGWVKDYVELGECASKIYWDPKAGKQIGWEPETDEEGNVVTSPPTQHPITGEMIPGQMQPSTTPVMTGDLCFEVIHGFDLRRELGIKSMDESTWLGFVKMVNLKDLKAKYAGTPQEKFIQESSTDTFRVFDGGSNSYKNVKDMAQVREFYFKPCAEYPNGYFYIFVENGILEEGELPFGIFPIVWESFDEVTTNPRGQSIIRQLRPFQVEINRAASQAAQHQITIGDTKVFLLSGSKPGSGVNRPGVRYETITGQAPVIVPGQTGEQFFQYIQDQIKEMYMVAELGGELEEKDPGQIDAYALLFKSLKQKKKFVLYAEKFEAFLVDIAFMSLKLMKKYAPPQLFTSMVGRNEQVNIQEFKSSDDLQWQIKVEPQTDDIETSFGKQLVLNNIIQYTGTNLDKNQLGKMIRLSPYLNNEKMLSDLTQNYDNATNDILALDRGEYPPTQQYEDHKYLLDAITNRVKQPDFRFKTPQIQQMYAMKIKEHQKAIALEAQQLQMAESGFIPTTGFQVAADFYVPDPKNPQSSKRVRVPSDSLQWLLKKLEDQGTAMQGLEGMDPQNMAQIGQMLPHQNVPRGMPQPQSFQPNNATQPVPSQVFGFNRG